MSTGQPRRFTSQVSDAVFRQVACDADADVVDTVPVSEITGIDSLVVLLLVVTMATVGKDSLVVLLLLVTMATVGKDSLVVLLLLVTMTTSNIAETITLLYITVQLL